ncbi:hypothetical protein BC830DRAFT_1132905 [Chytriomyces sp. MP71]|nr:hypothetical protein BC830DRAFT_1132905 [Chytriomyces sp. MP71]
MIKRRLFLTPRARQILTMCVLGLLSYALLIYTGVLGSRSKPPTIITYVTSNAAAKRNLNATLSLLRQSDATLNLRLAVVDKDAHLFGMSASEALQRRPEALQLCRTSATIVIGDSLPKARHVLSALAAGLCTEPRRIVIELYTRFDYGVAEPDLPSYNALIRDLIARRPGNLVWASTTIFEMESMRQKLGVAPPYVLLRPLGVSEQDVDPGSIAITDPRVGLNPALDRSIYSVFIPGEENLDHVTGFSGIPRHVLRMKCYVEFPAKVGGYDVVERLANGVPLVVPSARLMEDLAKQGRHRTFQHFPALYEISERTGKPWHAYVDYYDPNIAPYVHYVDSLDEIVSMIEENSMKAALEFDRERNVRERAPRFFRGSEWRGQVLQKWQQILDLL